MDLAFRKANYVDHVSRNKDRICQDSISSFTLICQNKAISFKVVIMRNVLIPPMYIGHSHYNNSPIPCSEQEVVVLQNSPPRKSFDFSNSPRLILRSLGNQDLVDFRTELQKSLKLYGICKSLIQYNF